MSSSTSDLVQQYLNILFTRYATITVPGGSLDRPLSLQAIFQPLKLRNLAIPEDAQAVAREGKREEMLVNHSIDALHASPTHKIVILGSPGMGKTTALKSVLIDAARRALHDSSAPLPILLALPDLARSQRSLPDYLANLLNDFGLPTPFAAELWQIIQQGRALLCLDSLDEVAPSQRPDIIAFINMGAREWGGGWIVGSRFTDYKGHQFSRGHFSEWELLPMTKEVRSELAERLLRLLFNDSSEQAMPSTMPTSFVQMLEERPQYAAWGENPLLFTLAAVAFVRTGAFPRSRALLYREVLDAILSMREPGTLQRAELYTVLATIALHFYQVKGRTFTRTDIYQLLPHIRITLQAAWDLDEMLERLVRCGLLDVVGPETYGFLHQTFQEYLAAGALVQQLLHEDTFAAAWKLAWSKLTYSRWNEILLLLVGILTQQENSQALTLALDWLQALSSQHNTPEGDPGDLGLLLAVRSLGEIAGTGTSQLATAILTQWIAALNTAANLGRPSRYENKRLQRLLKLAQEIRFFAPEIIVQVLSQLSPALDDPTWQVRESAAEILGVMATDDAIRLLLQSLAGEESSNVRRTIIRALNAQAVLVPRAILYTLFTDKDSYVQEEALKAYTRYGASAPLEPLAELFQQTNGYQDTAILRLLLQTWGQPMMDLLLTRWTHLKRSGQRLELLTVVASSKYNYDRQKQINVTIPAEKLLEIIEQDADLGVRLHALGALERVPVQVPIDTVLELTRVQEKQLRIQAIKALARYGEQALAVLISFSHDADAAIRTAANQALYSLDRIVPAELLLATLHDPIPRIRSFAIRHLYDSPNERIPLGPLLALLNDEDPEVRSDAQYYYQHLPLSQEQLRRQAQHEDPTVRASTMEVLARQGELAALLVGCTDPVLSVRCAALSNLAKLPTPPPEQPLLAALHDPQPQIRSIAVQSITARPELALPYLLQALDDEDTKVRASAAAGLALYRETIVHEALIKALYDIQSAVYSAALASLLKLKAQAPVARLLELLRSYDSGVHEQAWDLLAIQNDAPVAILLAVLVTRLKSFHDYDDKKLARGDLYGLGPLLAEHPEALEAGSVEADAAAMKFFKWMGTRLPHHLLFTALQSWHPDVRAEAVELVELHCATKEEVIEILLPMLQDSHYQVRSAAVGVLGTMGDLTPLDALMPLLEDESWVVRAHVVEELEKFSERISPEPLSALLKDEEAYVRSRAVQTLANFGARAPIQAIVALLDDWDKEVRSYTLSALVTLGEYCPLDLALQLLDQSDRGASSAAARILARHGNRVSPDLLLKALDKPLYSWYVSEILDALTEHPAVSDALLEHLATSHGDETVRTLAAKALQQRLHPEGTMQSEAPAQPVVNKPEKQSTADEPQVPLLAAVLDELRKFGYHYEDCLDQLQRYYPAVLSEIEAEVVSIIEGRGVDQFFRQLAQLDIIELIATIEKPYPGLMEKLAEILESPHDKVQQEAGKTLGNLRRNIPDRALLRLYHQRLHAAEAKTREVADNALAEILALETGIEDND